MKFRKDEILSEVSHYKIKDFQGTDVILEHFESGSNVKISNEYLEKHCLSGDTFGKEVKVTKDDKKDGTLGIRSLFVNIDNKDVFTVSFVTTDVAKTKKQYKEEVDAVTAQLSEALETAKANKKSMTVVAEEFVKGLIDNPILETVPGKERILRGFKLKPDTTTGYYLVMDMDEGKPKRVNILKILWLIHNGIKYIVQ